MFRPDENHTRFNKSAVRMAMPEVPEEIFIDGLKTLLHLENAYEYYVDERIEEKFENYFI